MNIALSDKDISDFFNGKTKIVKYPELKNYGSLDELTSPYRHCFVLYLLDHNYGHWCVVMNRVDCYEFFDSYGLIPDSEFDTIPMKTRAITDVYGPYLSYLLLGSKKRVEYNNYQFQEYKDNIATCGRHCLVRVSMIDYNIDDYKNMIDKVVSHKKITPDELSVLLTPHIREYS